MASRLAWFSTLMTAWVAVAACGGTTEGRDRRNDNQGTSGGGGSVGPGNMGGMIVVGPTGSRDPNDKRDVPVRKKVCDATGNNCTCLRVALLGTLASAATESDTQPFTTWLNNNSDNTAVVTMVSTKPTVNAEFLKNYDVLIVANINTWSFSGDEKAAVAAWVRQSGGGIINITGFTSTADEPAAASQLIEFAGFKFQQPETGPALGELEPVYYKNGSVDLKKCLHWTQTTVSHITSPIKFQPQTLGNFGKLTLNLDYVGAFRGWTVSPPAGATVLGKDPVTSSVIAAAHEVDGKGRIFAFGDEWVIFANQWEPKGLPDNTNKDQYNPCWYPGDGTTQGFYHSVKSLYQTKQFWFNAINWAAPPNECGFTVTDPDVVIR